MTNGSVHNPVTHASRLRIASDLGVSYASVPGVMVVFVGGSVARGWDDHWSDIELCVAWSTIPTDAQRRDGLADVSISHQRTFADPGAVGALEEEFVTGGIKVDVAHLTVAEIDTVIRDITEVGDPDLAKQALLSTLLVAIPLHGHQIVETWQQRGARYPDALSRAMIAKHLAFGPHEYLTMLAQRRDLLFLSDILCRIVRSVLSVLCGLNRVYPPSADFKWALRLPGLFSIAPTDLDARLPQILRGDPVAAVADAQRLIDETISLVELHLPEFDTAPIRARVSRARFL